jgi:hypothetical protein
MSFGFSPSDAVKLVEISTRVYIAFKGMSLPVWVAVSTDVMLAYM